MQTVRIQKSNLDYEVRNLKVKGECWARGLLCMILRSNTRSGRSKAPYTVDTADRIRCLSSSRDTLAS